MGENIPEDVMKAARAAASIDYHPIEPGYLTAVAIAARAILAERERCAKIAESHDDGDPHSDYGNAARDIATAIRSGVEDGRG